MSKNYVLNTIKDMKHKLFDDLSDKLNKSNA